MNYTSTNKENIEIVEQIAILAGYRTSIYMNKDSERSEKFSNCYKLSFSNKDKGQVLGGSYLKTEVPYSGDVACVTVPSGGIIVKQGDKTPFITGNCHANAGIYLINKYYEEDEFFEAKKSEIETNIKTHFPLIVCNNLSYIFKIAAYVDIIIKVRQGNPKIIF